MVKMDEYIHSNTKYNLSTMKETFTSNVRSSQQATTASSVKLTGSKKAGKLTEPIPLHAMEHLQLTLKIPPWNIPELTSLELPCHQC